MRAVKYIPNLLTFTRVALTPVFLLRLIHGEYLQVFAVFAVIGLSDLLDGYAARSLGACSRLGALIDVAADLFFIVSALIVLNIMKLAPVWLTGLVLFKFAEFCSTSRFMSKGRRGAVFVSDPLGRISAALFFLIPGIVCLRHMLLFEESGMFFTVFLACTVLTALASTCLRCLTCVKRSRLL